MKGKRTMKEKKYTAVLLMILVSLSCTARALELPLINGDFELPGTVKIGDWDNTADGDIPGWTSDERALESGVEMGYADPITGGDWSGFIYHTNTSVYNICDFEILPHRTYTLYVDAQDNYTSTPPAFLKMSLFYGTATNRIEIVSETIELTTSWDTYSISFHPDDYPAAVAEDIGVELENVTDEEVAEESWIGIDNVKIIVSDFVTLIGPADGSFGQPRDSILEWTVDNGWACNVYFGTDPNAGDNEEVVTNEVAGYYDPQSLPYATTFYWAVDAIDPNDGHPFPQPGPAWTFRTISDIPEIIVQPQSVTAFLGDTMQMIIFVSSAFEPHSYQWYRDDVALTDDAKHTGTQSDILTIHDIEVTDEQASYYCEVSNIKGTVTSDVVLIMLKRLLAHYKFENNLLDELGENDGSASGGKVQYVSGVDGMAVEAETKNTYIKLSTDAYPKAGVGNGLPEGTVSCWIKIGFIGAEYRIFGNVNSGGTAVILKAPTWENDFIGLAGFWIRDERGIGAEVWSSVTVCDNKWHHVVASWDTAEGFFRIYVDGILSGEEIVPGMGDFADWQYPMAILAGMEGGSAGYNYLEPLDELQFYNYAMTRLEIAAIYYDQTGIELCAVDYPAAYDLSGPLGKPDCVLDMYDMALLCASWLECGLYPSCPLD